MIADIRVLSQQLSGSGIENPKDLVSWMGAMQAQNYTMAKWAVGIRVKGATLRSVNEALERGEILRTHVMRPTWHFVAAEDIRWMLKLSGQRIKAAYESYGKQFGIPEDSCTRCRDLLVNMLEGNKNLTKEEIGKGFLQAGIPDNAHLVSQVLIAAEAEAVVCSGADKGGKPTYALLEERVPPARELHKEEALAELALRYFRSHSPASLNDFVWWSGLPVSEAKKAIGSIDSVLIRDRFAAENLFIHESWNEVPKTDQVLHLLPSYDEYLISYKDRAAVLTPEHYARAFNNWGIFYPVILYNGRIVGNWKKSAKKNQVVIETSFFEKGISVNKKLIKSAEERFREFHG